MLHELRIENLLLIERAEMRLDPGLNVITGETGAGKTILAHSLDLLMGGRARPQIVRPGADEAYVEGVFELPPGLLAEPGLEALAERLPEGAQELVLGRRIAASGRTAAFLQGRSASAADMRALAGRLLAFYGQHEHRRLALASAQLEVLDGFAGTTQLERLVAYRKSHAEVGVLTDDLDALRERAGVRERELDLLRYELSEIEATAPEPGEAESLRTERDTLRHAESLGTAAARALEALAADDSGARHAVAIAREGLAGGARLDPGLESLSSRAGALAIEIDDLASEVRSYQASLDAEPGRLGVVEERLDALERLERKHGGSVESVLAHAAHCRSEIQQLAAAEERGAELEAGLEAASARRVGLAAELTAARRRAARSLASRLASELEQLAMPEARLEVTLVPHPGGFGPAGAEQAEMLIATNPGIAPSPLRQAASGGELSRVMLALTGLAKAGEATTLVFDEIDAGIGGTTARAVAQKLRQLAGRRQVLCISHLPQVASASTRHFRIEKAATGDTARASVEEVEGEAQLEEICRMLGADPGEEGAARHARELLAAA